MRSRREVVAHDGAAGVPHGGRPLHHRRRGRQQRVSHARLCLHVSHFPPGTSKWNKVEHRLFCHITQNWRGRPLLTFETLVALIGQTRTATGLRVRANLDKRRDKTS